MFSEDKQVLKTVLHTEASFAAKIERLAGLCTDENLSAELFCYLNGLKDLKEDFLLPALLKTEERDKNAGVSLFSDKYRYFQST